MENLQARLQELETQGVEGDESLRERAGGLEDGPDTMLVPVSPALLYKVRLERCITG